MTKKTIPMAYASPMEQIKNSTLRGLLLFSMTLFSLCLALPMFPGVFGFRVRKQLHACVIQSALSLYYHNAYDFHLKTNETAETSSLHTLKYIPWRVSFVALGLRNKFRDRSK